MTDEMKDSHLRRLRLQAGLTVRELARQVGTHHTNVSTWERSGKIAKTECLVSMADALGVTLEEVLGLEPSRSGPTPGGRLGQLFETASKLPRTQQQRIIEFVEPFIERYENEREAKAS